MDTTAEQAQITELFSPETAKQIQTWQKLQAELTANNPTEAQIRHILSGKGGQYIILGAQKTVAHISASNRALFIFRLQCLLKFSYKSEIFISKTV
jgi:hypothetical protein